MLKSTFNSPKPPEPKRPTLPHLFKCIPLGHVVFFVSEHSGVELMNGTSRRRLDYSDNWVSCWNESIWRPLVPGESITITVESED